MINLNGSNVLITGGTGTFGKAAARMILENQRPNRLIIYSRGEARQAEMAADLKALNDEANGPLRFFIGDIANISRLSMALRGVDYVIHAAALKRVETCEYNPQEAVATNVCGAMNIVDASIRAGVKRVIMLSTDKAAGPTTLYGVTKLAAERIISAAVSLSGRGGPVFGAVRYGNVLGSTGSVIPRFRKIIQDSSGPVSMPITDPEMTRFFWTVEEAVAFVLSVFERFQPGEVLMPHNRSMRIVDLARAMAPGCDLDLIGLRPGEKLHETMITRDEAVRTIWDDRGYVLLPAFDVSQKFDNGYRPVDLGFDYYSGNPDLVMTPSEVEEVIVNYYGEVRR